MTITGLEWDNKHIQAYDKFIKEMKELNIWEKMDCIYANNKDYPQFSTINLRNPDPILYTDLNDYNPNDITIVY